MRPVRLEIVGLRSWRTQREINFDAVDLGAVVGDTGSGKSSILEAIVYALYNATTYDRRNVGSLISSDMTTMSVVFDFEANSERWRVTRSTSRKSYPPSVHKMSCLSNPSDYQTVEGEGPVNAAIKGLIGLDVEQFQTAVLLPQGRFQLLLMATPAVRSAILKGVFRLDELDDLKLRATNVRRGLVEPALDNKIAERGKLFDDPEGELVRASSELEQAGAVVATLDQHKHELDSAQKEAETLAATIKQVGEQAERLKRGGEALPALDSLLELDTEITALEADLSGGRSTQATARDAAQRLLDEHMQDGITVETLARAKEVLQGAQEKLPALDNDAKSLEEGRRLFASQREALKQEQAQYEKDAGEFKSREENIGRLREAAQAAAVRLTEATEAVRDLRAAHGQEADALRNLEEAEQTFKQLSGDAVAATADAKTANATATGAEQVYDEVRLAHEAAHVAAGLKPGEKCPVCSHELPDDFAPPKPPSALSAAQKKATQLRETAQQAAEKAATVTGLSKKAGETVEGCRDAVTSARAALADEFARAKGFVGEADLALSDDVLLTDLTRVSSEAADARNVADSGLTADRARLKAVSEALAGNIETAQTREQQLIRESDRIERERTAQEAALASLPPGYQIGKAEPDEFVSAISECDKQLAELQAQQEAVRSAQAQIDGLDAKLAELSKRRSAEVDTPRRQATTMAHDLALLICEATKVKVPKQPADGAPLSDHCTWVSKVAEGATRAADVLEVEIAERQGSRDELLAAADRVLGAASELVEEKLTTANGVTDHLDRWRARALVAEQTKKKASDEIPLAAALDEQVTRLRGRREALEEVARLLGDGHFIKWLVERRQQLLLAIASDIFAGMTGGRYRFAGDFAVIDGRTGIARNSKTLSGGESFMASLSLALGMAEIAARSGGRIGSLYLDEGFGALDPNALDEAINALEARARAGQMILVVSHVPAIAQRIERVLKVTPDPEGSRAEWLDDVDRDALLLQAAATDLT